MATMNMDIACIIDEATAKYVIAAGQENVRKLKKTFFLK